jgi:hypothetical protein
VEFRNSGTNSGVLRSSLGGFAPTGKQAEERDFLDFRVRDGIVVEGRDTTTVPPLRDSCVWLNDPNDSIKNHVVFWRGKE